MFGHQLKYQAFPKGKGEQGIEVKELGHEYRDITHFKFYCDFFSCGIFIYNDRAASKSRACRVVKRIRFAILQARLQKACLKQYLEPFFQCQQLIELTPERLRSFSVKLIALDFDGVLAAHGEAEVRSEVRVWMERVGLPLVVLSNKPNRQRIELLKKQLPAVEFIQGFRKKPYPDGLLSLMAARQLRPDQVLMIDDRILTGLLAACIAGCRGIIVLSPYRRLLKRPVVELFFECLRRAERLWLKM